MTRWKHEQPEPGTLFGRWRVVRSGFNLPPHGEHAERGWAGLLAVEVECTCPLRIRKIVAEANLLSGNTTSCGCLRDERVGDAHRTHGQWSHPYYQQWKMMMSRINPNSKHFIEDMEVYEAWKDAYVFISYLETELGPKPDGYVLIRIDPTQGYMPGNLEWMSKGDMLRRARQLQLGNV